MKGRLGQVFVWEYVGTAGAVLRSVHIVIGRIPAGWKLLVIDDYSRFGVLTEDQALNAEREPGSWPTRLRRIA